MAAGRLLREVLAYSLIAVFAADATAQSLGDVAREQKQKKATAQSDAESRKVFSNIDNPPAQAITSGGKVARNVKPQSPLQIDAPADGEIFNPGETINVRVTSTTNRTWQFVGILAAISDVPPTEGVHSLPAEFSITIPSNINACRRYGLTAMGRTSSGELVESDIEIDVERPDTPVSISSFQFPSLTLEAKPEPRPFNLIILAAFSDKNSIEVTESSYVSYESNNTSVATVEGYGGVKAVARGNASIIVTYKNPKGGSVRISVPVTVVPPTQN